MESERSCRQIFGLTNRKRIKGRYLRVSLLYKMKSISHTDQVLVNVTVQPFAIKKDRYYGLRRLLTASFTLRSDSPSDVCETPRVRTITFVSYSRLIYHVGLLSAIYSYAVPEPGNRKVKYADKAELPHEIFKKYHALKPEELSQEDRKKLLQRAVRMISTSMS